MKKVKGKNNLKGKCEGGKYIDRKGMEKNIREKINQRKEQEKRGTLALKKVRTRISRWEDKDNKIREGKRGRKG